MDERPWHRHYDAGVPRSIAYEPLTLPDFLRRSAERCPDAPAIVFRNTRIPYRALLRDVDRLATALVRLGARPGTRIAIQMPNLPQTVIAYYAALTLGGEVVLTNPLYTPREIEHQWNDAGCEFALVMDFLYEQKVRAIADRLRVRHFVLASIPEYLGFPLNWLAPFKLRRMDPPAIARVEPSESVHHFRPLLERTSADPPRPRIELDQVAVLQYTGGTTGVSKGAMLSHRNLSVNVQQTQSWFGKIQPGTEVILTALPLFHVFGMTICMNWAVFCAGAMVLVADPRDVKTLVRSIAEQRVTVFPGVPSLYNSLNNYPGIEAIDVRSVKGCLSGSAPIPVQVLERFERLTGARIVEGFGMSETSPLTHANPFLGKRKVGTVGIPVADTDAKIVDAEDPARELPVGFEGELAVRGPQIMLGYWQRPDETEKTVKDGWLFTGDLASMDEDGFFKIVGRKKDMINASGFKVFPDEVDAVLVSHEAVLEAATIGIPHPSRGEIVKSFVVLKPGHPVETEDLTRHCRERLAPYKVPREIEFLTALPKSTVLKVLRRELRERELAKRSTAP